LATVVGHLLAAVHDSSLYKLPVDAAVHITDVSDDAIAAAAWRCVSGD